MKDFSGKVAVITGAGRGIGRGIAMRCAKEGMKLVLAGIGTESLTATAADLQAIGAETLIVQTDVSKLEDVENLAKKTIEKFGTVDLLVNNAGVAVFGTVWDMSLTDWEWSMGVNLWGVIYGVRAFVPLMQQNQAACHIVNVSSLNGILPGSPRAAAYSVAKQGVVALSESLYTELALYAPNIHISVYCPGFVATEISDIERSRPARFPAEPNPTQLSPEEFSGWQAQIAAGLTIEQSADVLFEGIREDKLYIGIQGFSHQFDGLWVNMVRQRMENILNEENPPLPPAT